MEIIDLVCGAHNSILCLQKSGICGPPANCSEDGELIADKTACNNYYECQNGTYVEQRCPNGTSFDMSTRQCGGQYGDCARCYPDAVHNDSSPFIPGDFKKET